MGRGSSPPAAALALCLSCGFDSGGLGPSGGTSGATDSDGSASSGGDSSGPTDSQGGTTTPGGSSGSAGTGDTAGTTTAGTEGSTGVTTGSGSSTGAGSAGTTGGGEVLELPILTDTYINQAAPVAGAGLDASLRVGSGSTPDRANRTLVRTEVTDLPKCDIAFAELFLYYYADGEPEWAVENTTVNAYQMKRPWNETLASWNDAGAADPWAVPGGDFDPTVLDSVVVAGGNFTWARWDVTAAVTAWCNNPAVNVGLMLAQPADTVGMHGRKHFVSSNDWMNEATQPFLRVTLTP